MDNDIGYQKKDLAMTNNIDVIKKLIEEGCDINGWCICGRTPIHHHACIGNFNIIKYLLSIGADPYIKDIYGDDNAITGALSYDEDNIAKYIQNNII